MRVACIFVEHDVKCTRTCNIVENSCKIQYFCEVAIFHNHMFLHIFKRHCLDKSSSICCVQEEVLGRCFWGWKSVAVSIILGSKIRLVSIPIFRLGGTPPPPPSPPPPALKLRRRGPCTTDNCSGCHGKTSSCLARLVVPDSSTRRGGSADFWMCACFMQRVVTYCALQPQQYWMN